MIRRPAQYRMRPQIGAAAGAMLLAAAFAVSAAAQSSDVIGVQSEVSFMCADAPAGGDPLVLGVLAGADGNVVESFAGDSVWTLPNYWCNAPSRLSFTLEPLTNQDGSADANFTTRIDYSVALSWNGVTDNVHSDAAGPTVIDVNEAGIGDLVLTVSDPRTVAGRRLVAGAYGGAISITVAQQ